MHVFNRAFQLRTLTFPSPRRYAASPRAKPAQDQGLVGIHPTNLYPSLQALIVLLPFHPSFPRRLPHVLAFSTFASPGPAVAQPSTNCNTGPVQPAKRCLPPSLLGLVLHDTTAHIDLGCSPISAVGLASGNACEAPSACCENNSVGSLVSIGCLPFSS
ncbi:uncharacterized protein BXZ73DRAFT_106261 [Epithele typhae]|uniref:uncharacterized protein n=1 Tax=Epithele typhae TaxID=378194 RepID=UPI0020087CBB|nr:uncharacterized protein BXZ73DRAFT_106261 [Epithele typhae]KAH9915290.1 hypothetical protein BXZ73DRAFT_106261 [Epithele typhae]